MKNIIRIFVLLIGFGVNAQTYTFDYNLKIRNIKPKGKSKISTGQYIFNSENPNYRIYINNDKGVLYDSERNIIGDFLYQKKSNKTIYQFTSFKDFLSGDERMIDHIIIEKIDENKYTIKCYPTEKNKHTNLELVISLKPAEKDLIQFYYLDLSNNIHSRLLKSLKDKLDGNYNYIIENYTTDYKNGIKTRNYIDEIQKINLKITPQ